MDILSLSIIISVIIVGFGFLYWTIKNGQNGGSVDSTLKDKIDLSNKIAIIEKAIKSIDDSKIETKDEIVDKLNNQIKEMQDRFNNQEKSVTKNFQDQGQIIHNDLIKISKEAAKIGITQQSVEKLNTQIENFREMLAIKNKRGLFGEVRLESLLESAFGNDTKLWKKQFSYKIGKEDKKIDAMVFNEDGKNIPIDSKFPWENFKKMIQKGISDKEIETHANNLNSDLKKHIKKVAGYIDRKTTTEYSIMFIPVESIYQYIVDKQYEAIVNYAQEKKVVIVSPITLWPILQNFKSTQEIVRHNKNVENVKELIQTLTKDFDQFEKKWSNFKTGISNLIEVERKFNYTIDQLNKKFNSIKKGKKYSPEDEEQKDGD